MNDVVIIHTSEDRVACARLAEALGNVGLIVASDERNDNGPQPDAIAGETSSPSAMLVLWSNHSLSSEAVRADAQRALDLKARHGATSATRYVPILLDDTDVAKLSAPFDQSPAANLSAWCARAEPDFADAQFLGLLTTLEILTDTPQLAVTARAFAARDLEARKLRATLETREAEFAQLSAEKDALENALSASAASIATLERQLGETRSRATSLESTCAALSTRGEALEKSLEAERISLEALRSEFSILEAKAVESAAAQSALSREIEDARAGLSAALRQQKALQAQIDTSDQVIREIMTQRESLIAKRDLLERDYEKLTHQLADTSTRLSDSDSRRQVYESALVDRTKEIHSLEDKVATLSTELGDIKPRVDVLASTVKDWGHVPWRSIAAGSLALGAFASYAAISGREALDSWLTPERPAIAQSMPAITAATPGPTQPKTEAKIDPDTLSTDGRGSPNSFDVRDSAIPNSGSIPIPNDLEQPGPNDQVQFNPDGLPPVDTDSRPPPQDLPPMQQKPKLLLKPPPPATAER